MASHRIPAPTVRAMLAMSSRAQVKRARFAFTMSPSFEGPVALWSATGLSQKRSLALRPRLATGLPWAILRTEGLLPLEQNVRPARRKSHGPTVLGASHPSGQCPGAPFARCAQSSGGCFSARRLQAGPDSRAGTPHGRGDDDG